MTDLFAARSQMAISLGFHIIFAAIGIAMPFLMMVAHWRWLRTRDRAYLDLTKAWSRGVAIFFATGAVSGTVLSFELGLLWPRFMEHAGPIIGLPFSIEGAFFFLEAIFIGLFLYGWGRIPERIHWLSGLAVGINGVMSGLVVVAANGWMNTPAGFDWVDGRAVNIDPLAAMFNKAALPQGIHMTIAAFQATAFGAAGLHAAGLLRNPQHELHSRGFAIALWFAIITALLQPLSGDLSAKSVSDRQPLKLAAMEALFETTRGAPLLIAGIPDLEREEVNFGIEIPGMLSFLAENDFNAEIRGLKDFPREDWPPVTVVHLAFQVMVAAGAIMAGIAVTALLLKMLKKDLRVPWFLKLVAAASPLGFVAIEAGWTVTEVGRQPWIIYGIMKTSEAVTPMPGLIYPFILFTFVYLLLSALVVMLMLRQFRHVA